MKPENTEQKRSGRKKAAIRGALGFSVLQVLCAVYLVLLCRVPGLPKGLAVCFLVLAALCLLLILPTVWVLKIRWKEIEGGELDAADQY